MKVLLLLLISVSTFGQDFASIANQAARQPDINLGISESSDIIIPTTAWYVDTNKSRSDAFVSTAKPGDRIILQGPVRGAIEFHNLVGTKDNPITITATDKVLLKRAMDGGRVIQLFNCDYVRITGTDKNLIEITGGGHGVTVSNMSNHPEVDHLYIHNVGYSGIDITNYPTCDPKTWRGNTTLYDVFVHDNVITDLADGEGIYIGPSHYEASFPLSACGGGITSALEPDVSNVLVYYNIIKNVGADGIQVGGATGGGSIHHNQVYNASTKNVVNQVSGIQANPGSSLIIEDNIVDGCPGFGIISQGRTGTIVRRNLVKNTRGAIFTVAREVLDKGKYQVYNNTFIGISPSQGGYGVEIYTDTDFSWNILNMTRGTYFRAYSPAVLTESKLNLKLIGDPVILKLDASYAPTLSSTVPAGVGYKPLPVITKEVARAELVIENGIESWYLISESGKRKKIE